MYQNRYNKVAPVNQGDELDVKIEALGEKGDGIAKKNGFVLVVPGTQVNDEVRVKVTKVLKKVGFAEVISKSEKKSEDKEEKTEENYSEDPVEDSEDFGEEEN